MAVFEVKNLDECIERLGSLEDRDLTLFLWVDSKPNCAPIVKMFRLSIPIGIKDVIGKDVLTGINGKVAVLAVMDEHKNIYRLTDAESLANKKAQGDKK